MVLEKALESPLDCKEIKPVNHKEINLEYSYEYSEYEYSYEYAEAEVPILWPPDVKSQVIGKISLKMGKD